MKKRDLLSVLCACLLFALSLAGLAGCSLFSDNSYQTYDDSKYSIGGSGAINVENIDIDWVCGDISVVVSSTESYVSFMEESDTVDVQGGELTLRYKVYGNSLHIRFAKSGARLKGDVEKNLTVTLPTNLVDGIKINNVSGKVTVRGGTVGSIYAETVSGNVSVTSVISNEIEAKTVSGSVSLTLCTFQRADIETVSGDVPLWFRGSDDFRCTFETTSGQVTNQIGATQDGNVYTYGGGTVPIAVNTVSGDLLLVLTPGYE